MKIANTSAKKPSSSPLLLALAAGCVLMTLSCAQPAEPPKTEEHQGKHEYKELKPVEAPFPEGLKSALPGLQGDKIYMYKEIAPTLNLVSYEKDYSREKAIRMISQAFLVLAKVPALRDGIDFWIVQVQPAPEQSGEDDPRVIVWGVRPSEVDKYQADMNLTSFIENSEYLSVDDRIIPKGEERLAQFPDLLPKTEEVPPEVTPEERPPDGKPVP